MVALHILIPAADTGGVPFPPATDAQFAAELARLFGGSSMSPGLKPERWADGSHTDADGNRAFVVFLRAGLLAQSAHVFEAVTIAKSLYAQLAVSVRYLSRVEIL
jgi:hypothetical protein